MALSCLGLSGVPRNLRNLLILKHARIKRVYESLESLKIRLFESLDTGCHRSPPKTFKSRIVGIIDLHYLDRSCFFLASLFLSGPL